MTVPEQNRYYQEVRILIDVLPLLRETPAFALKGGTAINLFYDNMSRLSVDIDLCYLPISDRSAVIDDINRNLDHLKMLIEKRLGYAVTTAFSKDRQYRKLLVASPSSEIKIEPNYVLRGTCFPADLHSLCEAACTFFQMTATVLCLSFADVYGGKICAALSRQHPRDLFDIKRLLEKSGITDEIRKAFVIYLASSNRPMHELLNPERKNFKEIFEAHFQGMTLESVTYEMLDATRDRLIREIQHSLSSAERQFLLSLKQGTPKWDLMEIENLDQLPVLQWKLVNIIQMPAAKRKEQLRKLEIILKH